MAMLPGKIIIQDGNKGKPLAQTSPGARIYSIKDTSKLISLAKKATDRESTIALGKAFLDMTIAQDQQKPEYTDGK